MPFTILMTRFPKGEGVTLPLDQARILSPIGMVAVRSKSVRGATPVDEWITT